MLENSNCSPGEEEKPCKRRKNVKHGVDEGFFPDWLLSEILSHLPIKMVFRCKCVSKYWCAFISDPSFSRFYISRANFPFTPWAFVPKLMRVERVERPRDLAYPDYERLENVHSCCNLSLPGCYVLPIPNSQEASARTDDVSISHPSSLQWDCFVWLDL